MDNKVFEFNPQAADVFLAGGALDEQAQPRAMAARLVAAKAADADRGAERETPTSRAARNRGRKSCLTVPRRDERKIVAGVEIAEPEPRVDTGR